MLQFSYYGSDLSVQIRKFTSDIVVIGSKPGCDLVLPGLASQHFRVYNSAEGYYAEALGGDLKINGLAGSGFVKDDDVLEAANYAIRLNIVAKEIAGSVSKAQPAPEKKKKKRSCLSGCLLFFLALGLLVFGIYVWWVQPPWITKYFFWRPDPFHASDELPDPVRDAQLIQQEHADYKQVKERLDTLQSRQGIEINNFVTKKFLPGAPGVVETPNGSRLEIPPGAFPEDVTVEFGPKVAPNNAQTTTEWLLLTQVHVIRVNRQSHYNFGAPVTVELPALLGPQGQQIPAERIVPLYWDGTSWKPYGGPVTIASGKIRFQIPHATDVVGGIKEGLTTIKDILQGAGTGAMQLTGTRSQLTSYWQSMKSWDGPYKTTNFAIYYVAPTNTSYPGERVPDDSVYQLAAGRKSSEWPLYIQDMGTHLEYAHAHAKDLSLTPAKSRTGERQSVFVLALGGMGESPLGGPIYIDNDFDGVTPENWKHMFPATCYHEYMHVLQDEYYASLAGGNSQNNWLETSAEAFADLLLYQSTKGNPYQVTSFYTNAEPHFASKPMNGEGKGEDKVTAYAWATFFLWLETEGGYPGITTKVLDSSSDNFNIQGVYANLETAIGQMKGGSTLAQEFERFSKIYLHDDSFEGKIHSKEWWKARPNTRLMANDADLKELYFRVPTPTKNGPARFYQSHMVADLNRLTSQYYFVDGQYMKNTVSGKVVVELDQVSAEGIKGYLYEDTYEDDLPVKPATMRELNLTSGKKESFLIKRFGNVLTSGGVSVNTNRLNFVFVNGDHNKSGLSLRVRAWLLLPPDNVLFDKKKGGGYVVSWGESPLENESKSNSEVPFGGFNIYRRKVGEIEWSSTPLNTKPVPDHIYDDATLDNVDYQYAITVVDTQGNESEKSKAWTDDPFVGDWAGSIRLSQGHLVDVGSLTPDQRDAWEPLLKILAELEPLAKLGIPLKFKIVREETLYYVEDVTVVGLASDESERTGPMMRISEHNLEYLPEGEKEPVRISLEYPDTIQGRFKYPAGEIEWSFKRKKSDEEKPNVEVPAFISPAKLHSRDAEAQS